MTDNRKPESWWATQGYRRFDPNPAISPHAKHLWQKKLIHGHFINVEEFVWPDSLYNGTTTYQVDFEVKLPGDLTMRSKVFALTAEALDAKLDDLEELAKRLWLDLEPADVVEAES
jgi:hypothetical protein